MACILLATDGSENSSRAADVAAQLAKLMRLPLWVVNVTDHVGLSPKQLAVFSEVEHVSSRELIESLSAQLLQEVKDRIEAAGGPETHVETRKGDVAQSILELAQEKQATAIVIGKRGHGTLAGLLLGSVAQKLVSLAPRIVVVVP